MSLHGSACHIELAGNLSVVTTLQKQFHDLLFARSQMNGSLYHPHFLPLVLGLNMPSPITPARCVRFLVAPTMPF
jgi:hypothetical protein